MINVNLSGEVSRYRYDDGYTYCQIKQWSEMGYDSYQQYRNFDPTKTYPTTWQGPIDTGDKKLYLYSDSLWKIYNEVKRSTRNLISTQKQNGFYAYLTKSNTAYCDFNGWDRGFNEPVLGLAKSSEAISFNYIITGGATVRLRDGWVEGAKYQRVCAFDLSKPGEFLNSNSDTHWWLWHPTLQTFRVPVGIGKYVERIEPFPRTEAIGGMYLYVPFVAWGKDYRLILSSQLRCLASTEIHPAFPLKNWDGIAKRNFQLCERVARV